MGPVSHWFMKGFVQRRHLELSDSKSLPPTTPPEAFAAAFFDLGAVVEWSRDDDGTRKESLAALDQSVRDAVARGRAFYEADATSLDRAFPSIPYAPEKRLQIVLSHLRRTLILEAKGRQIAKNDGIDLSHATMAATYASIAALDKAWKRRVMLLPQPAQLAQVFYRLEVDDLVSLLEGVVEQPPPPPA